MLTSARQALTVEPDSTETNQLARCQLPGGIGGRTIREDYFNGEVSLVATASAARNGIRIDVALFDYELARRGLTARRLAALAGINEVMISRARHGGQMREATFIKLTLALASVPVLLGADALVAAPPGNGNGHRSPPETKRSLGSTDRAPRGHVRGQRQA